MIEYTILAIAFAIMVHIRYVHESLTIIKGAVDILGVDYHASHYSPVFFSIGFFLYSMIFAPIIAFYIFTSERDDVISDIATTVIKSYFQLEEK